MSASDPTITLLSRMLQAGETSSAKLCAGFIEAVANRDEDIGAFLEIDSGKVLKRAAESDRRRQRGAELSAFDGIPIAIKDNIAVKGERCTCASKILGGFESVYNATVVEKLLAKGFIPFGRTNMDEFAMGSSCENSSVSVTRNPWDLKRVPGGSSGGSAASVAAREAPAALGSDTGGSIRQPAAFCGVVGLKPTYGRVSRYGLVAFASSLDQIGPLALSVEDAAILLDTISGADKLDSTSLPETPTDCLAALGKENLKGIRIGLQREYLDMEGIDEGVRKVLEESVDLMKSLGAEIIDVSLPSSSYAVAVYYVVATAEASANLARFDGVRYGLRSKDARDLLSCYRMTRAEGFGEEVKRRILLGTFVLSCGYYDAYYLRAQKVRTLIKEDFQSAFGKCDLILSPVTPTPAFMLGEKSDPLQMYLSDIYTISLNLAGNCGISVPAGLDSKTGLPVGIQLMGPSFDEACLLSAAEVFEKNRQQKDFCPPLVK